MYTPCVHAHRAFFRPDAHPNNPSTKTCTKPPHSSARPGRFGPLFARSKKRPTHHVGVSQRFGAAKVFVSYFWGPPWSTKSTWDQRSVCCTNDKHVHNWPGKAEDEFQESMRFEKIADSWKLVESHIKDHTSNLRTDPQIGKFDRPLNRDMCLLGQSTLYRDWPSKNFESTTKYPSKSNCARSAIPSWMCTLLGR